MMQVWPICPADRTPIIEFLEHAIPGGARNLFSRLGHASRWEERRAVPPESPAVEAAPPGSRRPLGSTTVTAPSAARGVWTGSSSRMEAVVNSAFGLRPWVSRALVLAPAPAPAPPGGVVCTRLRGGFPGGPCMWRNGTTSRRGSWRIRRCRPPRRLTVNRPGQVQRAKGSGSQPISPPAGTGICPLSAPRRVRFVRAARGQLWPTGTTMRHSRPGLDRGTTLLRHGLLAEDEPSYAG
jgi:hypothetical protein